MNNHFYPPYIYEPTTTYEQKIMYDRSYFESIRENRVIKITDDGLYLVSVDDLDMCDRLLNCTETVHRFATSGGVPIILIYDKNSDYFYDDPYYDFDSEQITVESSKYGADICTIVHTGNVIIAGAKNLSLSLDKINGLRFDEGENSIPVLIIDKE